MPENVLLTVEMSAEFIKRHKYQVRMKNSVGDEIVLSRFLTLTCAAHTVVQGPERTAYCVLVDERGDAAKYSRNECMVALRQYQFSEVLF